MDYGSCADYSDETLVKLYKEGDESAFEAIYERYKYVIKGAARSYYLSGGDNEDLLQEGLWGLLKAVESYDGKKGGFKNYAYNCVRSKMLSAVKKANSLKNKPLSGYVSIYAPNAEVEKLLCENPEDSMISKENSGEIINRIQENLSKYEKNVLKLYLEGFSYLEISEKIGKTPKSVDNALNRIKRKIQLSAGCRSEKDDCGVNK